MWYFKLCLLPTRYILFCWFHFLDITKQDNSLIPAKWLWGLLVYSDFFKYSAFTILPSNGYVGAFSISRVIEHPDSTVLSNLTIIGSVTMQVVPCILLKFQFALGYQLMVHRILSVLYMCQDFEVGMGRRRRGEQWLMDH